jgi:hypothetical protein
MTKRNYYTLFVLEPGEGEQWSPQFGDYGRQVVVEERNHMRDAAHVPGTKYRIVCTSPDQTSISVAQAELNGIDLSDVTVCEAVA